MRPRAARRSDRFDPGVRRGLAKVEILRVQVGDIDVLEPDRASLMLGEIDHHIVPVGGDDQVPETGQVGVLCELALVDQVFAVGEIADRVVPVAKTDYEGAGASAARETVVARFAVKRVIAL